MAIEKDIVTKDLTQFIKAPKGEHITERQQSEENITEADFQKFCAAMEEYGHYLTHETEKIYNRTIMLMMLKLERRKQRTFGETSTAINGTVPAVNWYRSDGSLVLKK